MPTVDNNKKQVDLPVWEWLRFAPVATSAVSTMVTSDDSTARYLFYLISGLFYRYDTVTDSWQQLTGPNVAGLTAVSMSYTKFGGSRGNVLGATANSIILPALQDGNYKDNVIKIVSGTGAEQKKTITTSSLNKIWDSGVATTASAVVITDTSKRWKNNQWAGYMCSIKSGTGTGQRRKILSNTTNTLNFSDVNAQAYNAWGNTGFSAILPNAAPVATAGLQAVFTIESQEYTFSTNWDITPDRTSKYSVFSGGIWLLSSSAAAPFFTFQYYDIIADAWYTRTATGAMLLAAYGTDISIERTGEVGGSFLAGTATSGTNRTLVDTSKSMIVDRYVNYQIRITAGTGRGQRRRIVSNTATTFEAQLKWEVTPDATSVYSIFGNTDVIYMAGGLASAMYKYNVESDLWGQGSFFDTGVVQNMSVRWGSNIGFGVASATRATGGITAVAATPTVAGTGYTVGDILTVTTGGTLGQVFVESVAANGAVLAVSLYRAGSNYTTGAGKVMTGGTGSACTINISTIGTVGRITTTMNQWLTIGDVVTFSGATEAAWNNTYTIIGDDSLTTFDVITTATATAVASFAATTTLVVDASATWDVNEHTGKVVCVQPAGAAGLAQWRRIASNTATTLTTISAITLPVTGTSRYAIQDINSLGSDTQYFVPEQQGNGHASGGSTTTLVDTSKKWVAGAWTNNRLRIIGGTGLGSEIVVTSNSETTMTYATQTFTPDATTRYIIMNSFGNATASGTITTLIDATQSWRVNQWAGKRLAIVGGTGQGREVTISSNTATVLTYLTTTEISDVTSSYVIYGNPQRSAGIDLQWIFGNTNADTKGKLLFCSRGGASNLFDFFDIGKETWETGKYMNPMPETLTIGSMYAYDGVDRIYFQKDATGRIFYYDILTNEVIPYGTIPFGMSTAVIGNRMEIVKTEDGLKYLYIMRHTGVEMWRTLVSF